MRIVYVIKEIAYVSVYLIVADIKKQDRKCTYNVTFRGVRVTIFTVERQYVLYILRVCSLSYPGCKANVPYCHCGLSGSTTFFHTIS
jgi:hypothetical protein